MKEILNHFRSSHRCTDNVYKRPDIMYATLDCVKKSLEIVFSNEESSEVYNVFLIHSREKTKMQG